MRQEQERFRQQFSSSNRGVDTNPPRGVIVFNRIDTSGEMGLLQRHSGETHSAGRLQNQERWRFWTRRVPDGNPSSQNDEEHKENNRESREEEVPLKTYVQKPDRFEPFINQEFKEEDLFVNNYGGNYSQKMELNRKGVERALKIAHLDGKVFLTTLSPSRSRVEAQGDELAAKRFLLFEKKTQKVEEENPYKRVVSVPEGWRIELNDQRLIEELTEKRLGGERLQKAFIGKLNGLVKEGIRECVWREKCSSEKDRYFKSKLFLSLVFPVSSTMFYAPHIVSNPSFGIPLYIGSTLGQYGIVNGLAESTRLLESMKEDRFPNFKGIKFYRNIDHPLEYFMPRIEIDKVERTLVYLAPVIGKGRTLVREVGEKQ